MDINGIPTAQLEGQIELFHQAIEKYSVTTFIELGAFMGGLTYHLVMTYPNLRVHSFDLGGYVHDKARPYVSIRDVFNPDTIDYIRDIIETSPGTVLLFCDNGNKIGEFDLYYPLIRPGDLIQVHDYPREATPEFVERVNRECLDLESIDQETYLANDTVMWRKRL